MTPLQTTRPRTTLLWGGGGLVLAALLTLLVDLDPAVVESVLVPALTGLPRVVVTAVVELLAVAVLAFGVRGERGIAGRPVVGRAALVLFGAGGLVFLLARLLPIAPDGILVAVVLVEGLRLLLLASVVVAAVAVARAGVLRGAARCALLLVAGVEGLGLLLQYVPAVTPFQVAWWTVVQPAALLLTGILYVLQGVPARAGSRPAPVDEPA